MNYKEAMEKFGHTFMGDIFGKEITMEELKMHLLRDNFLYCYVIDKNGNLLEDDELIKERIEKLNINQVGEDKYKSDFIWGKCKETSNILNPRYGNDVFKVDEQYKYASGIYKIQLENEVYIGQTSNFWNRFYSHYRKTSESKSPYQSVLIRFGGTFEILEIEKDREQRLIKEKEYVEKYILDGYEVVNSTKVLYKGTNKAIKKKRMEEPKITITFNKSDLDKITKLLSDNNIEFKPHKFRDKKQSDK